MVFRVFGKGAVMGTGTRSVCFVILLLGLEQRDCVVLNKGTYLRQNQLKHVAFAMPCES